MDRRTTVSAKSRGNYALSQKVTQEDWDKWFPAPTALQLKLAEGFIDDLILNDLEADPLNTPGM